ncbi:MAG: ankyrin repeat domain-containing protein [Gammaproteobacteria bacterium]
MLQAAAIGDDKLVREMITHGADVEVRDPSGLTPLIRASVFDQLGAMKILLQHGARVNAPDISGHSAMYYATQNQDRAAVALLQRCRAKRN